MEQKLSTFFQQKWLLSKMRGNDYEITCKKGVKNKVADVLSRRECCQKDTQIMAISAIIPLLVRRFYIPMIKM